MQYRLEVDRAPETVPGGTGILLLHPSTADTDRIDSQFLTGDTDRFLVISTRTTADEVDEKLEFFGVDRELATIIDAISIERGYSRRASDRVHYIPGPDEIDGLLSTAEEFFSRYDGKLKMSVDSISELAFYSSEPQALEAVASLLDLLERFDAIGLFHLATGVHNTSFVDEVSSCFDVVIELDSQ